MINAPALKDDQSVEKTHIADLDLDAKTWLALYDQVAAFVARRVDNPMDAEDIVQRSFLALHQHVHLLRREGQIRAWVLATARNAVTDFYRLRAGRRMVVMELPEVAAPEPTDSPSQRLAECIPSVLGRLSDDDARAVRDIDLERRPQAKVAHATGVSLSGMKSRVQRARRRLRGEIERCCEVQIDGHGAIAGFVKRTADACACGDSCGCPA